MRRFARSRVLLAGVVLALQLGPAGAQVGTAQAEAVMRSCGLWALAEPGARQLRLTMEGHFSQPGAGVDAEPRARLLAKAETMLRPDALRHLWLQALAPRLAAADLPALKAWCEGATGQRVLKLEHEAEEAADDRQANPYAPGVAWDDTPLLRREVIEEITQAAQVAEGEMQSYLKMVPLLLRLSDRWEPLPHRDTEGKISAALAQANDDFQRQMFFSARALRAMTYKPLGDAELAAYLQFLKSPVGTRWVQARQQALLEATVQAVSAVVP